jgi:hypothetical protein
MVVCTNKKSPEQALFDMFQSLKIEQYKKHVLQQRYLPVLRNFHRRANCLAYMFYTTRLIVTIGSILVPAFLSIQEGAYHSDMYWATWVVSLLVTISNGFTTLFKLDKKYFFINTTLEMLHSEGWQYIGLSGRYSPKDTIVAPTHENQFLVFFHMAEKIKMRQVEEEYWKFTDTSGVGNATSQRLPFVQPTPVVQQGQIKSLPDEQKNVIERWVGDMNSNILGLQPRGTRSPTKVDRRHASANSRISESTSETPLSVRGVPVITLPKRTVVQETSSTPEATEVPQNTVVKVMYEESNVWE